MLCQKCGLSEATVHRVTTIFRQKIQEHLCQMCAGVGTALEPPASGLRKSAPPPRALFLGVVTGTHEVIIEKAGEQITGSDWTDLPKPDYYPAKGFDHIEPYIDRLLVSSPGFRSITISTPDGNRGLCVRAQDDKIEVSLIIELQQEPNREEAVRNFVKSLGINASKDFLADTGGAPDSVRCLLYPISGPAPKLTSMVKRILKMLCGISPTGALNIMYAEK